VMCSACSAGAVACFWGSACLAVLLLCLCLCLCLLLLSCRQYCNGWTSEVFFFPSKDDGRENYVCKNSTGTKKTLSCNYYFVIKKVAWRPSIDGRSYEKHSLYSTYNTITTPSVSCITLSVKARQSKMFREVHFSGVSKPQSQSQYRTLRL
jgi:hypothetical protein